MSISALTIAGFDPSGGAGLQADLRVFAAAGLGGWSVATAITVQDTTGVYAVHPIDAGILREQLDRIFRDALDLRAVKIGMLGGAAQVRVVADALRRWSPRNVVLDPVLASTGGTALLDEEGLAALKNELMPLCDVVTPNLDELPRIGRSAKAVVVKGGHGLGDESIDELFVGGKLVRTYRAPRVMTSHGHGTGCALAAAIAAELALGSPLEEAVGSAKALVGEALRSPMVIGRGRGSPDMLAAAATMPFRGSGRHSDRIAKLRGICVITDVTLRRERSHEEIARAALAGGARAIQLRDKSLPVRQLVDVARRLREWTREHDALLIINDRADVAVAVDADGVHVGPDDIHPADARRIVGPDRLVGVSVSSVEEAAPIAQAASYFGVGAIFGSTTKADAGVPVGVERIDAIRQQFPGVPIVAIGGINPRNLASVAASGADAAAVISAVAAADDMDDAVAALCAAWNAGRP
jgi:hydroxymethylpyrimidine kinase / phosphomethylpyrimidine kinase / thiamine-phosphate diphosphorylase